MGAAVAGMAYTLTDFRREWFSDSPYVVAHTSGSTGTPKEIGLLKDDMRVSARATNAFFGITAASVLSIPLGMDYIAGKMMAVRAFEAGCGIDVIEARRTFDMPRHADLLAIVPQQASRLIDLSAEAATRGVRVAENVIIGGARLAAADECLLRQLPMNIFCTYGMTETCSHVALRNIRDDSGLYRAMPGITFSADTRGCLVIEAPAYSFMRLVTNDVVEVATPRSFRWLGRYDHVINSGGVKLHPEQLEALYARLLPGRCLYVVGVDDREWGQCAALVVEGAVMEAPLIAGILRDGIADHKLMPKKVWMVESLPRTHSGKVRREVPGCAPTWERG